MVSWYRVPFIPELRLADRVALPAWKKAPLSPKMVIVNYCELMKRGILCGPRLRGLARKLKDADALILSAVGRDELLDKLTTEQYHETAVQLGAKWVISPDDYVYDSDCKYPFYQDAHFSRAIERALRLLKLARGHYNVIGLAIGSCIFQLNELVATLEEHGVEEFALPCGDLLKQVGNRKRVIGDILAFVNHLKSLKLRSLLLGVDSPQVIALVKPDSFASSAWSFDAARGYSYTPEGKRVKGSVKCQHTICTSSEVKGVELPGVHNILANRDFMSKLRGS
nr:hypothetical protein [Candidatus Njordarchaeota archaeon]